MRLIDVSVGVSPDLPVWPEAPKYELKQWQTKLSDGTLKTDSHFSMIPHLGTHIDAPLHFNPKGASIDQLDINLLVGPCRVYEQQAVRDITREDLLAMRVSSGPRVLIKTVNSERIRAGREFDRNYVSLEPDAIDYLLEVGVRLLGVDGSAIGAYEKMSDTNHARFCGAGGVIIEVLDLSNVEPGDYELIALPIKMVGLEAAPARVLLIERDQFPYNQ